MSKGIESAPWRPSLEATPQPWCGMSVAIREERGGGAVRDLHFPHTTVVWTINGGCDVRRLANSRVEYDSYRAGNVLVIARGSALPEASWSGDKLVMIVEFDTDHWAQAGGDDLTFPEARVEFDCAVLTYDAQLLGMLQSIRSEMQLGRESPAMYRESLSRALAAYVGAREQGSRTGASNSGNGKILSYRQRMMLTEFIRANLGRCNSLRELASATGISTARFARLFKNTYGVTPYQHVLHERVTEAQRRLVLGKDPIGQIAVDLGFSSHSHFTMVFRRVVGMTPKQVRRSRVEGAASG